MKKHIIWLLNDMMKEEVVQHARSSARIAHRNEYWQRYLKTGYGYVRLLKPQMSEFSIKPKIFERYSATEEDIVNMIIESYLQCVFMREVETVISHLEVNKISPSYV